MRCNFGDMVTVIGQSSSLSRQALSLANFRGMSAERCVHVGPQNSSCRSHHRSLPLHHLPSPALLAFGLLCNHMLVPECPAVPRQYSFDGLVKELGGLV